MNLFSLFAGAVRHAVAVFATLLFALTFVAPAQADLVPLDDVEMNRVYGQGLLSSAVAANITAQTLVGQHLNPSRLGIYLSNAHNNPIEEGQFDQVTLGDLLSNINLIGLPFGNLFSFNGVTISNVQYANNSRESTVNPDGSIQVALPAFIGEIRIQEIRIGANDTGSSLGGLRLSGVHFNNTTVKVNFRD